MALVFLFAAAWFFCFSFCFNLYCIYVQNSGITTTFCHSDHGGMCVCVCGAFRCRRTSAWTPSSRLCREWPSLFTKTPLQRSNVTGIKNSTTCNWWVLKSWSLVSQWPLLDQSFEEGRAVLCLSKYIDWRDTDVLWSGVVYRPTQWVTHFAPKSLCSSHWNSMGLCHKIRSAQSTKE